MGDKNAFSNKNYFKKTTVIILLNTLKMQKKIISVEAHSTFVVDSNIANPISYLAKPTPQKHGIQGAIMVKKQVMLQSRCNLVIMHITLQSLAQNVNSYLLLPNDSHANSADRTFPPSMTGKNKENMPRNFNRSYLVHETPKLF
jgi:hypothetical protein